MMFFLVFMVVLAAAHRRFEVGLGQNSRGLAPRKRAVVIAASALIWVCVISLAWGTASMVSRFGADLTAPDPQFLPVADGTHQLGNNSHIITGYQTRPGPDGLECRKLNGPLWLPPGPDTECVVIFGDR